MFDAAAGFFLVVGSLPYWALQHGAALRVQTPPEKVLKP